MKIRKGDKVKIISGKDRGAEGVVEKTLIKKDMVLVSGVNMVTKHMKASGKNPGGITKVGRPIQASNVMIIDPKTNKPTRVGYKIVDGKKYRIFRKSGDLIDKRSS